jgi:hypothetical protein
LNSKESDITLLNTDKNEINMFPSFKNCEITQSNITHGYEEDRQLKAISEMRRENEQI